MRRFGFGNLKRALPKRRMSLTLLTFLVTVLVMGFVLPRPVEAPRPPCCVVGPPYPNGTQWNQIYGPNTGTTGGGGNTIQNLNSYPSSGLMTVYQISYIPLNAQGSAWAETKAGFTLDAGYWTTGQYTITYGFQISFGASLSSQCSGYSGQSIASATVEFKGNMVDATTGSALFSPDLITTVWTQSITCSSGSFGQSNQIYQLRFTVNLVANHHYLWVAYLDVQTGANTPGLPASATVDVKTSPYGAYFGSVSWPG